MKQLLLLRHAKSAWPDGVADHDRPLADRGRRDAPRMGAYIAKAGLQPDFALVSSALRTQETWGLVAPEFKPPAPPAPYPRSTRPIRPPFWRRSGRLPRKAGPFSSSGTIPASKIWHRCSHRPVRPKPLAD